MSQANRKARPAVASGSRVECIFSRKSRSTFLRNLHPKCCAFLRNHGAQETTTLIKSTLQLTLTAFAVTVLAVASNSQESSSRIPVLPATPAIHVMPPAPNFRVVDFRLGPLDDDDPAPPHGPI